MRILLLNYEFSPYGGEAGDAVLALLNEYSRVPEMEVDVVTSSADGNPHTLKMGDSITVYQLPIKKIAPFPAFQMKKEPFQFAWKAYWFSRKLARTRKYDCMHTFFSITFGVVSMLLKAESKLPYVISLQGSDHAGYLGVENFAYKLKKSITKKIFKRASVVVANSKWLRDVALSTNPGKEIALLYNGIDLKNFQSDLSRRDPGQFRIVCVSPVTRERSVRSLIQAFNLLAGRYDQARLTIVGDGNERQSLEDLAQGLGIEKRIEFVGEVPTEKTLEYYQKSDVLVLPSAEFGISKPFLSAMACGLPVIGVDTPWTREIIEENRNGLLTAQNNPDLLVEKIEKLILDKKLCENMSANSLSMVDEFSWENVSKKYVEYYIKAKNVSKVKD